MSLFKRKASRETDASHDDVRAADELDETAARQGDDAVAATRPESGPYDVADVPELEGRVDLGALRLPLAEGMELRLEVEEGTGRVVSAQVAHGAAAVQVQAFAAPRTDGIWDEIRQEIAAAITQQGGTADEVGGPFGTELLARVPAQNPDGRTGYQALRFAGVDGPRWFMRAVFSGEAATTAEGGRALEQVVSETVVVRGDEPMPARDLLALRLPEEAVPAGHEGDDHADHADHVDHAGHDQPGEQGTVDDREPLRPFERGPEITERR